MDDDGQSIIEYISGSYMTILKFQHHLIWKNTNTVLSLSSGVVFVAILRLVNYWLFDNDGYFFLDYTIPF